MSRTAFAFLAVITGLSSTALTAQTTDAATTETTASGALALSEILSERIDVVEVQLEVLVTDRDGLPIDDLRPSDFTVELGGEIAEVLAADLVGADAPESLGTEARPALGDIPSDIQTARSSFDDRLTLVLYLDIQNISPIHSGQMLGQVYAYLDANLKEGDRVMVASHDRGVTVRQPLTEDLDDVRKSLTEVINEHAGRLVLDPEKETTRILKLMYDSGVPCPQLEHVAVNYAEEEFHRAKSTIDYLQSFVESLAGLPGRKALLHVSDGLPLIAGRGVMEFLVDFCTDTGLSRGVHRNPNIDPRTDGPIQMRSPDQTPYDLTNHWVELAARANRNHVTFYPVQALGLRDPTYAGADLESRLLSPTGSVAAGWNRQDPLVLVALETGGTAILNQNHIDDALARMKRDLRHYYRLSVRTGNIEPGEIRKLKVRVDREGAQVRHRKTLHFRSRRDKVADRVLTAMLHTGVHDPVGDNPMGLRAEPVDSVKTGKNRRKVRVNLEIPLSSLTLLSDAGTQPPAAHGIFTVFVAAADSEGTRTPVRRSTQRVSIDPADPEAPKSFVFEVEMEIRKVRHELAFGVLDEVGGGASFLRVVVGG